MADIDLEEILSNIGTKAGRIKQHTLEAANAVLQAGKDIKQRYSENKEKIDSPLWVAGATVAGSTYASKLLESSFLPAATVVAFSAAYGTAVAKVAKKAKDSWGTLAAIDTYMLGLATSIPFIHGILNFRSVFDTPITDFLKESFTHSQTYASVATISYLGAKGLKKVLDYTKPKQISESIFRNSEEEGNGRREFIKSAARTTGALAAAGYLGAKGVLGLAYSLSGIPDIFSKYPKDSNRYEDVSMGILVSKPKKIEDGNLALVDIIIGNSTSKCENLTARYFMIDTKHEIPEEGSRNFYRNMIYLGERSDLDVENGKCRVAGFFEYDKTLEDAFGPETAFINPMTAERDSSGRFKFLVEIWDGDQKLDHKFWGNEEQDSYFFEFERYEKEEPEKEKKPRKKKKSTGVKKVFVYKQVLNSSRMDTETEETADYVMHHFYDFNSSRKMVKRCSQEKIDRLKREANANGTRLMPMVSAFKSSIIQNILNNPKSTAETIATEIRNSGYEGVTIDFETIRLGSSHSQELVNFMKELRQRLPEGDYEIAIATSPRFEGSSANGYAHHGFYDYEGIEPYVDYIHLMAYDFHKGRGKAHSPVLPEDKIKPIVEYAQEHIQDQDKVVFLMPFYGYVWTKGGSPVGTLSARYNDNYSRGNRRYDNGELRVETDTRIAYIQDEKVFDRRLDLLDDLGVTNVGGWRQTHATTEIFETIREWK